MIGEKFQIFEHYKPFEINFHDDQNRKIKIDIDKENGIYRIIQDKLIMVLYPEDFSIEEVSSWLKRNVRHSLISATEMSMYIDFTLNDLSKDHSIQDLSLNRFRLKEKLQEEIAIIISEYAKKQFSQLVDKEEIDVKNAFYTPDESIKISRLSTEHFQKHLFEMAGYMNGEETEFAMRLDGLDNIKWWFRSREKEDFYLQGWRPNKFYPDFIAKTNDGNYILAEYKGEDRLSNEDTEYKVELGSLWEKLSNGKNKFYLVGKSMLDEKLKEMSEIS